MADRITKARVFNRFEACQRMAQRCGVDTSKWDLQIWNGSQYVSHDAATGRSVFGEAGGIFATSAREAYAVMGGYLAAMKTISDMDDVGRVSDGYPAIALPEKRSTVEVTV